MQPARIYNIVIAMCCLGAAAPAMAGGHHYSVKNLGTLGGNSYGTAINNHKKVVAGYFDTASGNKHAFTTDSNGNNMTDIGTLGGNSSHATGINNNDKVVGYSNDASGNNHAFVANSDGSGKTDLGTLGGKDSIAKGINNNGQIVGYSNDSLGRNHAFTTDSSGHMHDLGTMNGGNVSYANGINNNSQVVGYADDSHGYNHAFITNYNGNAGMTDLGTQAHDYKTGNLITWGGSYASGINDSGMVVGYLSDIAINPSDAFVWENGNMTDLGSGKANSINSNGVIVGYITTTTSFTGTYDPSSDSHSHATMWTRDSSGNWQSTDCNSYLSSQDIGNGWIVTNASGINTDGSISGSEYNWKTHETRACLIDVSPVPEPQTWLMMLCGLGLIGFIGSRNKGSNRSMVLA